MDSSLGDIMDYLKHPVSVGIVTALLTLSVTQYRRRKRLRRQEMLKGIVARKRQIRQALILEAKGYRKPKEAQQQRILNCSVSELQQGLRTGEFTSQDVVLTFIHQILEVGLKYNMIADVNFDEALKMAKEWDQKRENGEDTGILGGIPISLQDVFYQKDQDNTNGVIALCFRPADQDGLIIKQIRDEGGIPLVRSMVPQAVMSMDSYNNIYGKVIHPIKQNREVGGTSSGEAPLILTKCSVLGLSSEVVGSARYPSLSCGVTCFTPSRSRGTNKGVHVFISNKDYFDNMHLAIKFTPVARQVDDLVPLLRAVWTEKTFKEDPFSVPLVFNDVEYANQNPLKIGLIIGGDIAGCMKRCMKEAKEALEAAGHTVVELQLPELGYASQLWTMITSQRRFDDFIAELNGEELEEFNRVPRVPRFVKMLFILLLRLKGQQKQAEILNSIGNGDIYHYHRKVAELKTDKNRLKEWFIENELDAIVQPGMPCPAVLSGKMKQLIYQYNQMLMANIYELPVGVVPVTRVLKAEEKDENESLLPVIHEALQDSEGLPLGVQVTTLTYQDEKCLRVMKDIERYARFH